MKLSTIYRFLRAKGYTTYTLTENAIKGDHEVTLFATLQVAKIQSPASVRYVCFENLPQVTL